MKRLLAVAALVLALAIPSFTVATATSHTSKPSTSTKKVYVEGCYRKDGTHVAPHYRSAPESTGSSTSKKSSGSTSSTKGRKTCPRDEHGKIKRNEAAKKSLMKQTGYPNGRPGYVVDHIIPLECGGVDDPSNMQWQTVDDAKAKDKAEGNCRN
jgi:5-methylcytosine-specific restriction endonuclease McrA